MARGTGTANLAASLEVLAGAPLDARTVVPTVADLTTAANFPYKYVGLPVVVQATGDLYILTGNDVTVAANWKKVGEADPVGSDNVVEGYYNSTDHLFYEESTYTTAITGESEVIYVALDTNKTYRYNGLIFVRLDEESGGGGGGHTIVDEVGNDMTPENKLQFTYGLKVQDVSENLTTQVMADEMAAADMAEVIPSLPGVMSRMPKYSTSEQVVGQWIDGKPLYQKTVDCGALPNNSTKVVDLGLGKSSIEVVSVNAVSKSGNQYIPMPYISTSSSWNVYFEINDNSGANNLYAQIITSANWSSATCYVTIQYTKTTD